MTWSIQYVDTAKDRPDAEAMLAWLSLQVDFLAGRVLPPGPGKPDWRVQAFFEDVPDAAWLPDGCRRVVLPFGFYQTLRAH